MDKSNTKIILVSLLIVAGTGIAYAHADGDRPDFATLDADGSGEITAEDLTILRQNRFNEMDTDGDGSISEEEFVAGAKAKSEERAAKMFARLDADGDGALSQDTLATMGKGRMQGRMLEKFDTDGSGGISEEEFAELQKRMRGKRHDRRDHN